MTATNWTIQAGEPFPAAVGVDAQRIRVTLPAGRDYWLDTDDFEVLCQIRASRSQTAELKADLAEFLTVTLEAVTNDILIDWSMTGADTRLLEGKGGRYDMVVSDVGATDANAMIVMYGQITVHPIVTAATKVTP